MSDVDVNLVDNNFSELDLNQLSKTGCDLNLMRETQS